MAAISVYRKCFSVWQAWFGTKFQGKIEEKVLEYITNHSNYESDGNHWGEDGFLREILHEEEHCIHGSDNVRGDR